MLKAYKKIIFSSLVFVSLCGGIILTPFSANAASIVPCSRNTDDSTTTEVETDPCTVCHLFLMAQRVVGFITKLMAFAAIAVITAAGIIYIVSSGNSTLTGMAKSMFTTVLTGFILILSAYVIINTIFWLSVRTPAVGGIPGADENSFLQSVGIAAGTTWSEFTCDTTPKISVDDRKTQPPGSTPPGGGGTPKLGGTIGFESNAYKVFEGGSITIKVTRTGATEEEAGVDISLMDNIGGKAAISAGTVNFLAGETVKYIVFTLSESSISSDMSVDIIITNISNNAELGTNSTTVKLKNKDMYAYKYNVYSSSRELLSLTDEAICNGQARDSIRSGTYAKCSSYEVGSPPMSTWKLEFFDTRLPTDFWSTESYDDMTLCTTKLAEAKVLNPGYPNSIFEYGSCSIK